MPTNISIAWERADEALSPVFAAAVASLGKC